MRMMAAAWIRMRIGKDPKISHAGEDELLTAMNNAGDTLALTQGLLLLSVTAAVSSLEGKYARP